MSEADDLVRAHIATDHARQPGLEWLIDDATFVREIRFAPVHEIAERQNPASRCRGAHAAPEQNWTGNHELWERWVGARPFTDRM
jgi:hypothetical protein